MSAFSHLLSVHKLKSRTHSRAHLFHCLFLLLILLFPFSGSQAANRPQGLSPRDQAQALLQQLTPEERVGQLFLVTFQGSEAGSQTPIYDLIVNHYIGGVVLLAKNDNFSSDLEGLDQVQGHNRQLQLDRWAASQQTHQSPSGEAFTPSYIPLFIATSQEGDGYPNDQILNGLTPLPDQMAIGATWNPALAEQAGAVLGKELSALGINMLLGPSLDVLETLQQESGNGLGTRSFGGDPFWVGKMGKAFITGVHQGSQGKIAVVAKHFPGIGSADRLPQEEVATVRKSLEQLENFDLAPFYDVTGNAPSPQATADALLTSHIRYQGFQGNIRATTRPISFDQQAFNLLMTLPPLAAWRQNGGVVISDDLGSKAVRRFFELTNPSQPFDIRRVALNAFLAGNDLLYLGDVTSEENRDAYTTIIDVLAFFSQKYREDPAFAQRVDEAVLRILTLKYRLYGTFSLVYTLPPTEGIEPLSHTSQVPFEIAREAATLISPSLAELEDAIPDPPNRNERIVFITDARSAKQCSQCSEQPILAVDALQQAVIRLYGPQAGRLITPYFLTSYSYQDLIKLLEGDESTFQMQRDLRRANWVVFAMLDVTSNNPTSQALHRFLAERPDLFQQKRLIVFAFNAPYFLDATNISKLTAYYALYSKGPSFIDVAARLLFRELRPAGALPVTVPGIGYDLFSATQPDPKQTITLQLDLPEPHTPEATGTPEPQPTPVFNVGNIIPVRTGVILDHNGHPVPDGTQVMFIATLNGEASGLPQTVSTQNGIARTTIQVNAPGVLEIRAESEPAKVSQILHFEIPGGPETHTTTTPTETPTLTPTIVFVPTPLPTAVNAQTSPLQTRPYFSDWLVIMFLVSGLSIASYKLSAYLAQVRWGVRSGFLVLIGGLLAYSYLALGLPGARHLMDTSGAWGIVLVTLLGCGLGILIAWGWRALLIPKKPQG